MGKYYDSYMGLQQQADAACTFIGGNQSSALANEIDSISANIRGINVGSWQDSVKDAFTECQNSCYQDLSRLKESVSSILKQIEEKYKELKEQLDALKEADSAYTEHLNHPIDKNSFAQTVTHTKLDGTTSTETVYPGYVEAQAEWFDKKIKMEAKCTQIQNKIQEYLSLLDSLNSSVIEFSEAGPSFVPLSQPLAVDIPLSSSPIYNYYGADYIVLAPFKVDSTMTAASIQDPDYCFGTSKVYAQITLNYLGKKSNEYKCYSFENRDDAIKYMVEEIKNGRPVLTEVTGHGTANFSLDDVNNIRDNPAPVIPGDPNSSPTMGKHCVMICGVKLDDVNSGNITESSLLYLDPAAGQIKQLAIDSDIQDMQTRYLMPDSKAETPLVADRRFEYFVGTFNDSPPPSEDVAKYIGDQSTDPPINNVSINIDNGVANGDFNVINWNPGNKEITYGYITENQSL